MKENTSMSQEVISVKLAKREEQDILIFDLPSEENPEGLLVDLNSEQGQADLKVVFTALLEKMLKAKISLKYSIDEGYSVALYKDVCKDYVEALDKEIKKVYDTMRTELELEAGAE